MSGVHYLVIHGFVTMVTEKGALAKAGKVVLTKKEIEHFWFRMRVDAKQNKLLDFKWT